MANQRKASQGWDLDALGNWARTRVDKDGNGAYAGSETEARAHTMANELLTRTFDPGVTDTPELGHTYDFVGTSRPLSVCARPGWRWVTLRVSATWRL